MPILRSTLYLSNQERFRVFVCGDVAPSAAQLAPGCHCPYALHPPPPRSLHATVERSTRHILIKRKYDHRTHPDLDHVRQLNSHPEVDNLVTPARCT